LDSVLQVCKQLDLGLHFSLHKVITMSIGKRKYYVGNGKFFIGKIGKHNNQLEINEKVINEIRAQKDELEKIKDNEKNSSIKTVEYNLFLFQSQIYQSNIKEVRVNGELTHEK